VPYIPDQSSSSHCLSFLCLYALYGDGEHRSLPAHKGFRLLGLCFKDEHSQCKHNLCFRAKFLNHGTTYKPRKNCRLQLGQLLVDFHRSGKRHISSTKVALYQISKYALKNWHNNTYITGQHFLLIQANETPNFPLIPLLKRQKKIQSHTLSCHKILPRTF